MAKIGTALFRTEQLPILFYATHPVRGVPVVLEPGHPEEIVK